MEDVWSVRCARPPHRHLSLEPRHQDSGPHETEPNWSESTPVGQTRHKLPDSLVSRSAGDAEISYITQNLYTGKRSMTEYASGGREGLRIKGHLVPTWYPLKDPFLSGGQSVPL